MGEESIAHVAVVSSTETGLDYFGARYFSGAQGRFTNPDSGPYSASDPQTFNRYAYTRNNPLKYIDPNGMYFVVAGSYESARQYISILLRSPSGRALVQKVAADPRATFVGAGRLPFSRSRKGWSIVKASVRLQ